MGCCETKTDFASNWENQGHTTTSSSKIPGLPLAFETAMQQNEGYPTLMLTIGNQEESACTTKACMGAKQFQDTALDEKAQNTMLRESDISTQLEEGTDTKQQAVAPPLVTPSQEKHESLEPQKQVGCSESKPESDKVQQDAHVVSCCDKPDTTQPNGPAAEEAQLDQRGPKEETLTFEEISEALRDPARAAKLRAVPDQKKLQLYALFKQGSVGNVNTSRPGWTDMKGRAKWDAWKAKEGMNQDVAKQNYMELVSGLHVL